MTSHRFFVTGTDTEVGKTSLSCTLLHLAKNAGMSTVAGKPVASGSEMTNNGLRNSDAISLQAQCSPYLDYSAINPIALEPAIAPHIAAKEANMPLTLDQLVPSMKSLLEKAADFTVIEGAGGWRVPLNDRETLADLAKALKLPVIIVVGVKLGAINHARLTYEAIRQDGLEVAGWIANICDTYTATHPEECRLEENLESLRNWLPAPCLGVVPYLDQPTPESIGLYLDFDKLINQ